MRFFGRFEFPECGAGDHKNCPGMVMGPHGIEECSCDHHEAVEAAAWDEETGPPKRVPVLRVDDETRRVLGLDDVDRRLS